DDDHSLQRLVREHASHLAELRRLPDSRFAKQENRLPQTDDVVDDIDRAFERATNPAGQTHDLAMPVSNRADSMKSALDACSIVGSELADRLAHELDIVFADDQIGKSLDFLA